MKKGFTLIELLAVYIILGVILSITYYSVDSILDTSSESLSDTQKRELEKSAELFYLQEGMDLNATCVTVSYLLSNKYIEHSEVVDPQTNQDIIGYTVKNNHFGANEYFIFTDEAIYIQDENGEENGIWYKLIEDVKVNESDLLIMHHGGSIFVVPNSDEWTQILEKKRLRLFLLVAANITHEWIDDGLLQIEGKHVFSIPERIQLSSVRLSGLEGKSVLWGI